MLHLSRKVRARLVIPKKMILGTLSLREASLWRMCYHFICCFLSILLMSLLSSCVITGDRTMASSGGKGILSLFLPELMKHWPSWVPNVSVRQKDHILEELQTVTVYQFVAVVNDGCVDWIRNLYLCWVWHIQNLATAYRKYISYMH